MHRKTVAHTICLAALILVLLTPAIPISFTEKTPSTQATSPPESTSSEDFVEPMIQHVYFMDRDFNNIQDRLESLASQTQQVNESTRLPVVVTLVSPVASQDLENFKRLGGEVTYIYDYVTYGFAGTIPASGVSLFANLEGKRLSMIEQDVPLRYHMDLSAPLTRVRPTVWDTHGYTGSQNQSIAIIDTGIDDAHPDLGPYQNLNFSSKIVGWYDATSDGSPTPEDYGEHGTHVAAIAAGTGSANSLQGSGSIETTFTYVLPPEKPGPGVYGYIDYIDVMTPGVIRLNCSWGGVNTVWLILSDPAGSRVMDVSGASSPLILAYNTSGTSYPTGRYEIFVGNIIGPSGTPFSCIETYPYQGLNDGYNLFRGVAPNSKLVGVKVFDNTGSGTFGTLIDAMDWIIENRQAYNIVVASMSLSLVNGATDTTLDQKADTMVQNGIVTIASAGNDYPGYTIGSPGSAAYVVTVAATNDLNGITGYSSNGDAAKNEFGLIKPDVAAPGGTFDPLYGNRIISADSNDGDGGYTSLSDQNPDDYQQMGGTSMSAPHVAGLAALTVQALGSWNWTIDEALKVKMLMSMTAFESQTGEGSNVPPINRGGKDNKEGYGRVNADAAIEAATMNLSIGQEANGTLGFGYSDKKVWARQVYLTTENEYQFNLTVPVDADYDLYMYNGTPDSYGQPIILVKSTNTSLSANETIQFIPNISGTAYIVVKWVNGEGNFSLSSTATIIHDVAVTDVTVSDTTAYVGDAVVINVTVHNYGGVAESFNVTAYYNSTAIEVKNVSDLAIETYTVLTFSWNTSEVQSCSNYTIKAEASVVPGESNTLNNLYFDGNVEVKMQGDVNGDGIVNVVDLTTVSFAYGSFESDPDYNPEADLNKDGIVDMKDLTKVARNLGKTCS